MRTTSSISSLIRSLRHENTPASQKAAFALEGLVLSALAPDKEAERKRLALDIAKNLSTAHDETILCLLLQELQKLAVADTENAVVDILKDSPGDSPRFTYALNLLRVLKTQKAADILQELCLNSSSKEAQLLLAIARLEMPNPSPKLIALALKMRAPEICDALASAGVSAVFPLLKKTLISAKGKTAKAQAIRAMADYFDHAQGESQELRQQALEFLQTAPGVPAIRAILKIWGETPETQNILFAAIRSGDSILRNAALQCFATGFQGSHQTEILLKFTASLTDADARNDDIFMLESRNDPTAQTALRALRKPSRTHSKRK